MTAPLQSVTGQSITADIATAQHFAIDGFKVTGMPIAFTDRPHSAFWDWTGTGDPVGHAHLAPVRPGRHRFCQQAGAVRHAISHRHGILEPSA
jgi:hypothetical protein